MNRLTIRCLKAGFAYLALGIGLGALFGWDRALGAQLRSLHAELNLWGWATLLIYGMAYHMLPRFTGNPLRQIRAANAQSILAIVGVGVTSLGWIVVLGAPALGRIVLAAGGFVQLGAALLFAALAGDLLLRGWPARVQQTK